MDIICGIDGGGTKTIMELRSLDNVFLCRKTFGAFNINSIGEHAFEQLAQAMLLEIKKHGDCKSICIGTAGSSNPRTGELFRKAASEVGYAGALSILGDHEIAMAGALGDRDGLILIAGTGSICYGRKASEKAIRCGGWGHLLDDAGSAYAIARDGFQAAVRSYDNRIPKTLLQEKLFSSLSIRTAEELVPIFYSSMDKAKVASYAGLVVEAAEEGDIIAGQILKENARALYEMAAAVIRECELKSGTLAFLGGVFANFEIVRDLVTRIMAEHFPDIRCVMPGKIEEMQDDACKDAAAGAADLAFAARSN